MFAYTALPFSLAPQISLALFFLSILFATAAGVTAFLLLASGNLQSLHEKFGQHKRPHILPILADNGEVLATKDDIRFHIDILETKLKNKIAELEAWKGKLSTAETEMHKLSNASGEVRRYYMKLKTDVGKTEDDCKELQNQIDEWRRRQAEICPELVERKSHPCPLLNGSKGVGKTRSDTPPEAYGRVTTVIKSLNSLSSIQHFKTLTGAISKLLKKTLSSIGIILPYEAYCARRRDFELSPNLFCQKNIDQWTKTSSDLRRQKDYYIYSRSCNKNGVKVVNFPFPPKSPPPTFLSNIILWAIRQLRVKKATKDRAVNHCGEFHAVRSFGTGRRKDDSEQRFTKRIADRLKTLMIFQFLEDEEKNRPRNKNTIMNNEGYRQLAKLLKVNDSVVLRLLSEAKSKDRNGRLHQPKKSFHESSRADADVSTSFENPSSNNNEMFSCRESENKIEISPDTKPNEEDSDLKPKNLDSSFSRSKLIYMRNRISTSKDHRKSNSMGGLAGRVNRIKNIKSTSQLQKNHLHSNDVECLKNESETPIISDDSSTNDCNSKQLLRTFNSKVSSTESESIAEKKIRKHLECIKRPSSKSSFDRSSTNRDSFSCPFDNIKPKITPKLTKEQMCLVSILPQRTSSSDTHKTEAISSSLLNQDQDPPLNVVDKTHEGTVEQTSSIPHSSSSSYLNEKKSPTKSSLTLQKKCRTDMEIKAVNTYSKLLNKVSYSSQHAKNSKDQLGNASNKVQSVVASETVQAKDKKSRNLSKHLQANGLRAIPFTSSQRESSISYNALRVRNAENSNLEFRQSVKSLINNQLPDLEDLEANKPLPVLKYVSEANEKTEPRFKRASSASEHRTPKQW